MNTLYASRRRPNPRSIVGDGGTSLGAIPLRQSATGRDPVLRTSQNLRTASVFHNLHANDRKKGHLVIAGASMLIAQAKQRVDDQLLNTVPVDDCAICGLQQSLALWPVSCQRASLCVPEERGRFSGSAFGIAAY